MDEVSKDARPRAVSLDFWVKSDEALSPVHVDLVENGSLAPLFFGLGLISEEEYVESGSSSAFADHDLLEWLRAAVDQAVEAADRHHALKNRIDEARALLESKYELAEIQVKVLEAAVGRHREPFVLKISAFLWTSTRNSQGRNSLLSTSTYIAGHTLVFSCVLCKGNVRLAAAIGPLVCLGSILVNCNY